MGNTVLNIDASSCTHYVWVEVRDGKWVWGCGHVGGLEAGLWGGPGELSHAAGRWL